MIKRLGLFLVLWILLIVFLAPSNHSAQYGTASGPSSILSCTTGSIGGGALLAGASASGPATCTGATTSMVCTAQPTDGTNMYALGANIGCTITSANTATVNVVAIIAFTPVAKSYTVRVTP